MRLSPLQTKLYPKLKTPDKIQDFLNTIPINFEEAGETYMSPLEVLKNNKAHCAEGALLAASILRFHGHEPLVMDLRSTDDDVDHMVTLFQMGNTANLKNNSKISTPKAAHSLGEGWGCIGKTNHATLRYREPIYRNLRELAMSFFHEYFDNQTRRKNLREYSGAVNLKRFDYLNWETTDKNLQELIDGVDQSRHYPLINRAQIKNLRLAEPIEIEAGKILEWPEPKI